MKRVVLLLALLALTTAAHAQRKARTPAAARTANETAFQRALGKLKLKKIKLAAMPADPQDATDDGRFVATVIDRDPTFVVDASKGVYRVVRKIKTVGRVKVRVCNKGPVKPVRVKRTRFDVPSGHTFIGDVEVSYDAFVLDEQNTCRKRV